MKKSLSVFAVFLVFLAMGFGDAANQLVSIVQEAFHVTPFTASFVSLLTSTESGPSIPATRFISVPASATRTNVSAQ